MPDANSSYRSGREGRKFAPRCRPQQEITILILKNKINFMFDRSEFTHPLSDETNTKSKSVNSDCLRGINSGFLIKKEKKLYWTEEADVRTEVGVMFSECT